jgi:DNA-binding transcriptional regulator YiaG
MRPEALYNALLNPTVEYPPPPRLVLEDAIRGIYEGEKPEMKGLPDEFSKDFPLDRFRSLYFDSLWLKREYVCEYRNKKQIRQIYEVKGLLLEDAPSPKADCTAPWEPVAAPQPPQPQAKARKKHGAISAGNAAKVLGVSERTVRTWDADINRPDGYTGRDDEAAFHLFANKYNQQKMLAETARAMNRPVSGGGIADHYSRSAFDED